MPAKRFGASKTRSAKLRAFLRYSVWVRAQRLHSEGPEGYLQAGAVHQLEEEVR